MKKCYLTRLGHRVFVFIMVLLMLVGSFESTLGIKANIVLEKNDNPYKEESLSENEIKSCVSSNDTLSDEYNDFGEDDISNDTLENNPSVSENDTDDTKKLRVLFIGNSFTDNTKDVQFGSVKDQLEQIAVQNGKQLEIRMISYHAARLQYFYEETDGIAFYYKKVVNVLRKGNWDYVVLQEKTLIALWMYESDMKPVVKSFKKMISELQPSAKVLLYMTPGYNTRGDDTWVGKATSEQDMERQLGASYDRLGYELGIDVVYAGMHVARAKKRFPNLMFQVPEDKHPNANGYFVIALCFYEKFFGEKANVDVTRLNGVRLSQGTTDTLTNMVRANLFASKRQISLNGRQTYKMNVAGNQFAKVSNVKYISLNPNIASVSATGRIKGLSSGNTTIVAQTEDGMQAFCNVNVSTTISFERDHYMVGVKEQIRILPSGLPLQIVWKSSNRKIASVAQDGTITAIKPGKTVITVYNKKRKRDRAKFTLYVSCEKPKNILVTINSEQSRGTKMIQYRLHWNRVQEAKEYRIYRSDKRNGKYKFIGRTSKNVFVDKKVYSGCNRFYKIVAVHKDKMCNSLTSDIIKASTLASPSFTVKRVKKKYTELTFNQVKHASEYLIYRSKSRDGVYEFRKVISNKQDHKYREETNGKRYYYKIIACSKNGTKMK